MSAGQGKGAGRKRGGRLVAVAGLILGITAQSTLARNGALVIDPSGWAHVATVGPQYLSFNIEMAEVTGGDFWAPYGDPFGRRLAPRPPLEIGRAHV